MADKRKHPPTSTETGGALTKRQRQSENGVNGTAGALTTTGAPGQQRAVVQAVKRTSALRAPIMELSGHVGEVFAVRFDSTGHRIASGSFDRSILLWNTYGDCENYGIMDGHKGAILDLQWSRDGRNIYTASADHTLGTWDVTTGERTRKHVGHEDIVNSVAVFRRGGETLVSGSDDCSIGLWDPRSKAAVAVYEDKHPICAVAFSNAGDQIYSGGLDEEIKVWDETITSLAVSPNGSTLLSNSMDNTVKIWNIQPFAPSNRLVRSLEGAPQSFEKNLHRAAWSADGQRIAAGSGDRTVVIWDATSGKLEWKLPGHTGSVNDVCFSPTEPIIASASTDRKIILGELI